MRFERGDLLADRWLANAQSAGDRRKAAAVHHPDEQADGIHPVHTPQPFLKRN